MQAHCRISIVFFANVFVLCISGYGKTTVSKVCTANNNLKNMIMMYSEMFICLSVLICTCVVSVIRRYHHHDGSAEQRLLVQAYKHLNTMLTYVKYF